MDDDKPNSLVGIPNEVVAEWRDEADNYIILEVYIDGKKDHQMICDVVKNSFVQFGVPRNELDALTILKAFNVRIIKIRLEQIKKNLREKNINFFQDLVADYDTGKRGIL